MSLEEREEEYTLCLSSTGWVDSGALKWRSVRENKPTRTSGASAEGSLRSRSSVSVLMLTRNELVMCSRGSVQYEKLACLGTG